MLPTGIDWERLQRGEREKTRKQYGIERDEVVCLSNGRIDQEKNLSTMIKALFPLLKSRKNLKFMFVGEGPLADGIKKTARRFGIADQVIFTGLIDQMEIQHSYSAADIFVQTSLTETQGMSLLEGLATGLAVVAIDASGSRDQIKNGVNGVLTKNDVENYRQAVEELVDNKQKRKTLGEKAREDAKSCGYRERAKVLCEIYERYVK